MAASKNGNFLSNLYQTVIVGNQKAIVAFVVAAVGTFVARHGYTLDASLGAYLQAVLLGVIAHGAVWFTTNTGA